MNKSQKGFLQSLFVVFTCLIFSSPAFAQSTATGGAAQVETMATSLSTVADKAYPVAVGVTGFAIGALLIKRVLYA